MIEISIEEYLAYRRVLRRLISDDEREVLERMVSAREAGTGTHASDWIRARGIVSSYPDASR